MPAPFRQRQQPKLVLRGKSLDPAAGQKRVAHPPRHRRRNLADLVHIATQADPVGPRIAARKIQLQQIVGIGKAIGMRDETARFKIGETFYLFQCINR